MSVYHHLTQQLTCHVDANVRTRTKYSRDASVFQLEPSAVVYPRAPADIAALTAYVQQHKESDPALSITPRGCGTDVSGGAINTSLIVDLHTHLTKIQHRKRLLTAQAGASWSKVMRRLFLPPSLSWEWPDIEGTVGGALASGNFLPFAPLPPSASTLIQELKVCLSDGKIHTLQPLSPKAWQQKRRQHTFEGHIYRELHSLVTTHPKSFTAHPKTTTANCSGYNITQIWNHATGGINLAPLFLGSQGTLGIITEATLRPQTPYRSFAQLFVSFADVTACAEMVRLLSDEPGVRLDVVAQPGLAALLQVSHRQGGIGQVMRLGRAQLRRSRCPTHQPLLIVTVGANSDDDRHQLLQHLTPLLIAHGQLHTTVPWQLPLYAALRQQQLQVPLVADITVPPAYFAEAYTALQQMLARVTLPLLLNGHASRGHFYLTPLGPVSLTHALPQLLQLDEDVRHLANQLRGTISGGIGDGLLRGPALQQAFGPRTYDIFLRLKHLFDPLDIFNPHKKIRASRDFSLHHLAEQ